MSLLANKSEGSICCVPAAAKLTEVKPAAAIFSSISSEYDSGATQPLT